MAKHTLSDSRQGLWGEDSFVTISVRVTGERGAVEGMGEFVEAKLTELLNESERQYAPFAPQLRMERMVGDDDWHEDTPHEHAWQLASERGGMHCPQCLGFRDFKNTTERHEMLNELPEAGCSCGACKRRRAEIKAAAD